MPTLGVIKLKIWIIAFSSHHHGTVPLSKYFSTFFVSKISDKPNFSARFFFLTRDLPPKCVKNFFFSNPRQNCNSTLWKKNISTVVIFFSAVNFKFSP